MHVWLNGNSIQPQTLQQVVLDAYLSNFKQTTALLYYTCTAKGINCQGSKYFTLYSVILLTEIYSTLQCICWNRGHPDNEKQSDDRTETIYFSIFRSSRSNVRYQWNFSLFIMALVITMSINKLKGHRQELSLEFLTSFESAQNSWRLACGLCFTWETLLWSFLLLGCSSFLRNDVSKISVFQGTSFGDLFLNGKWKKLHYYYYYFVEQQTDSFFVVCEVKIKSHKILAVFFVKGKI